MANLPKNLITHVFLFLAASAFLASSLSAQIPLIHYTFDESDSGTQNAINQGSALNADGSFVGEATRTGNTPNGFTLGALDLTSPEAGLRYVTAGTVAELTGLAGFTLSTWINLQATPSGNLRLLANQSPDPFDGFSWTIADPASGTRSAGNFSTRMFIGGSTGFTFDPIGTHTVGADNVWTFLAVTYDGTSTSNNVNYYMGTSDPNDSVVHLATTTINAGLLNNSAAFNVGHTDAAPSNNLAPPGYLDDARVYGTVLTLADLQDVRDANIIPEPSTYALLAGLGVLGLAVLRRRFRAIRS